MGAALAMQQQLGLTAEVRGAAKAMVSHAVPLNVSGGTTDIVGTGGDGFATVNLSTMGSVAAAAAGVKIVKHGNRAASSKCGAADVLEALGLPLDLKPEAVGEVGDEVGHHLRVRPHFPPGHAFRGADSCRAWHPVRLQHPGTADQPRQPGTRGHRLRQPQGEPDYGSRVRQPWTVWLGLHLHEGMDDPCPHRPGFRLGDSRGKVTESSSIRLWIWA